MEARKAAAEMEGGLLRDLQLPENYTMIVELEQSMRQLRRRGDRALTILIGPSATVSTEAYVEILVFLDAPRACLFAYRDGVDAIAHLPKRQRHPRASTYAQLAQLIAVTINEAFDEVLLSEAA
jgi:hypothetical protein